MTSSGLHEQELLAFIERVERINAEIREKREDRKEIFAEVKGRGYKVKYLNKVIQLRAQDPDTRAEDEAMIDMYKEAAGIK